MATKLMLFTVLFMAAALAACHGEKSAEPVSVKLPVTGQTLCYDVSGSVISCAGTGQDGELHTGEAWAVPRFADQSNGTMLDNATGLVWIKDVNATAPAVCAVVAPIQWQAALDYVTCLNTNSYLGFTDWRLPNVVELRSLADASQADTSIWLITLGFSGIVTESYWSSTSAGDGPSSAWGVDMGDGAIDGDDKYDDGYVWPVRTASSGSFTLPRSGQTNCYESTGALTSCAGTGQDGDARTGTAWSDSRFTDRMDGTMRDTFTNLVWSKEANAPGPAVCSSGATKNWQASFDYVKCLNRNRYLGYSDWRLPNRNELSSLVDYAQLNQTIWLAGAGFTGVQAVFYWSSSSCAADPGDAWGVDMGDGDIDGDNKNYYQFVWPVRSGQ